MKFMKKFVTLTSLLMAASLLSGCFGSQKPVRYYTMVLPEGKSMVSKAYPSKLFVKKASIDPAYRRNNIVYRESPYDFMFYNYSAWATRPEHLVEQAVALRFEQSGIFQMVETALTAKPDFELNLHVIALEEIDGPDGKEAHLAMNIAFRKVDGEGDLWTKRLDRKKSYSGDDMREFATAVSSLLESFTQEALGEILKVMENLPADALASESLPAAENVDAPETAEE